MLTFYSQSRENAIAAVKKYWDNENIPQENTYYVLDVEQYSSEGNTYVVLQHYSKMPTKKDIRTLAENIWNEYYEGQTDKDKDSVISEMLDGFIWFEWDGKN